MAVVVPVISTFDSRGIEKAIKDFKKLEGWGNKSAMGLLSINKGATELAKSFAKVTAVGGGLVGVIGSKLVNAAIESRKMMAQTEAIITATGGAAGVTSKQVADLSRSIANQVGIDDELIQKSANLLLTFKAVKNQVGENNNIFDQAVQAAVDLGSVFGSTDAAAKMLGKALSDPVKGITALKRAGVDFTEQQKDQIKALAESGRTLEAQKMILAEVQSQVGGTAAATATGFDKMKVAIGNVSEDLGELLLPFVERFANFVTTSVVPVMQTFTAIIGERGIGAGIEYLGGKIIGGILQMGNFGKAILAVTGAFAALRVATITYTGVMGALNVITTLSNGALSTLITRLGAAKVAMLAAGGITALLSVAAIAYGIYAKRKSDATERTQEFAEALKLEGQAQTDALVKLYKTDAAFKENIDTLTKFNYNLQDFEGYLETGTGGLLALEQAGGKWLDTGMRIDKVVTSGSEAITKQTVAFFNLRQEVPQLKNATDDQILAFLRLVETMRVMRADTVNTQTALGTVTSALGKTGKEGAGALDAELQKLIADLQKTGDGTNKVGKEMETAEQKMEKARRKFSDFRSAAESVFSTQKSLTDATKDTQKAMTDLTTATQSVYDAQAKLNQIQKGYGADSQQAKDAQTELTEAQREAERVGYALERANFAVKAAEADLATAREEGDPTAIREAEIRLAEAKLDVKDAEDSLTAATKAVTDAQTALNTAISGASTESQVYKDALAELKTAQDEEVAAVDRVNQAKIREFEITKKLTAAQLLLAKSKKKLSKKQIKQAENVLAGLGEMPELIQTPPSQPTPSLDLSGIDFSALAGLNLGGIPIMGNGGIVMKPTLAMIGESGPEAVVPLDRGGAGGDVYYININSKIADETLPDLLVAELRKFNRRSGAINIQVA